MSRISQFKHRLRSHEPMVGTWVKTPSHIVAEILAATELEVLCLDAEHGPFERGDIDRAVFACRSLDMPVLVRTPSAAPDQILNALDLGADGVVIPHVSDVELAAQIVQRSYFGPDGRGYAGSTRAANYTRRTIPEHMSKSRERTVVIAQIEDVAGVDNSAAIAAIPEIDCLFIGRVDLCVALGAESPNDPAVTAAVEAICDAAKPYGRALGMFVPSLQEVPQWIERGVSFFLLDSDQSFLIRGASYLATEFRRQAQVS